VFINVIDFHKSRRIYDSAKALAFENVPTRDKVSLKMSSVHPS
jgi:hypothetical protein